MTDREVMQQALEALESGLAFDTHSDVLQNLRTALEQQAEPSQWRDMIVVNLVREGINKHRARELADHFATQPTQQAEPVAVYQWRKQGCADWYDGHPDYSDCGGPYETRSTQSNPPQRQWVGLEPEEILDLFDRNNVYGSKWIEFARTVEAKLKERNSENSNQ